MNQRNPYLEHVKRLEFSVTHRCRSRCAHCALGPDRLDGELLPEDAAAALEAVDRACALESVLTFGGEPLLCVPIVCAVQQRAEDLGIPRRQLITSGCFTHDKALREHTADRLEASGVNEILLSVDAFHTEHLPIAEQYAFARALCEAGLGSVTVLHPTWLKGPESRDPYDAKTRACLRRFESLRLPVGVGNRVFPGGNARIYLADYFQRTPLDAGFQCGTAAYTERLDAPTSLAVDPDGSVRVCGFVIGNLHREAMADILGGYNPNRQPLMRALLEQGIPGLIAAARDCGIEVSPGDYDSPCALCRAVARQLK